MLFIDHRVIFFLPKNLILVLEISGQKIVSAFYFIGLKNRQLANRGAGESGVGPR